MSNYDSGFSLIAKLWSKNQYPPYPRGTSKYYDWFDEQEYYCLNGFQKGGDKISGKHYFHLNFNHIGILDKNGNKVPAYPYYADSQREFFDKVEYCYKEKKNLIGLKARDKGWTYLVSSIALWNTQFQDGSSILCLCPGGTSVAKPKFRAAYDMGYNNLEPDLRYPYLKNTSGKNQDQIIYGWKEKDPESGNEIEVGSMSVLDIVVAVDSSVVRAGRSKLIIVEELGEIQNPKEIISVARANMKEGSKKFGIIIAGGTSNHLNENGFKDFRDIWFNPDELGFEKIFIPAQKIYWGYVDYKTGKSDEAGALKEIERERKNLKGKQLQIFNQEYPTNEHEAFVNAARSPFDAIKCANQIAEVLANHRVKNSVQRGNLHAKKVNGEIKIVFEIEENGRWEIFKHPDSLSHLKNWVVGGVDSYRLGGKAADSDSQGAIEIYIPEQGLNIAGSYPICTYLHRDEDKDVFFMDCMMTAIYYSTETRICKLLIEYTDEDIITFFRQRNALKYLKERPSAIPESPYSKATNKYGIHPTEFNRSNALEYAINDFNQNYDSIVFIDLLDEMSNFGTKNTDRVWAHNWAVAHAMDNVKVLTEYQKPKPEKPFMPRTYADESGRLIVVNSKQQAIELGIIPREPIPNQR